MVVEVIADQQWTPAVTIAEWLSPKWLSPSGSAHPALGPKRLRPIWLSPTPPL